MKHEYFTAEQEYNITSNAGCIPPKLYPQMRDWTCSLACIRSIISDIIDLGTDEDLIAKYDLTPGPLYSANIKRLGVLNLEDIDVIYGCDKDNTDITDIWYLLDNGYRVMVEWMYSYDHWTVLLSYLVTGDEPDFHTLVLYDPYCGEIFTIRAGHFISMWESGNANSGVRRDYIAVRGV